MAVTIIRETRLNQKSFTVTGLSKNIFYTYWKEVTAEAFVIIYWTTMTETICKTCRCRQNLLETQKKLIFGGAQNKPGRIAVSSDCIAMQRIYKMEVLNSLLSIPTFTRAVQHRLPVRMPE